MDKSQGATQPQSTNAPFNCPNKQLILVCPKPAYQKCVSVIVPTITKIAFSSAFSSLVSFVPFSVNNLKKLR